MLTSRPGFKDGLREWSGGRGALGDARRIGSALEIEGGTAMR